MPNSFNIPTKDYLKNNLPPSQTDATLLLTATTPKQEELLQHLEKNKVLIVDETPKTIVDSNFIKKTTDALEQQTNDQQKRRALPAHVREHFEESSRIFGNFVKETEKNSNTKVNDKMETELWDKAIFFQEYPNGRKPLEIKNELSSLPFAIPKKQNSEVSPVFPTRITADASKEKEQQTEKIVPFHPIITVLKNTENLSTGPKNTELPFFIPKKSEPTMGKILPTQIVAGVVEKNSTPKEAKNIVARSAIFSVPQKPTETASEKIRLPRYEAKKKTDTNNTLKNLDSFEMGDVLKEKIIEGQLKNIFENAPDGIKTTMEKMPAKVIFSTNNSAIDANEIWKTKLRDYVIKLKWQGKTVLGSADVTNPKENETVLEYVRRIYPAIVRAEVTENNKDKK